MRKSNEKISLKKWENPTEFLLPLDREFDHCWVEKGGEWKEIRSDSSFIFASNRVSSSSRLRIRFVSACAVQAADKEESEERGKEVLTTMRRELFSGKWTIFLVGDYVSLATVNYTTSGIGFVYWGRWMERYRHFERIDRQTFDILAEEEDPSSGLSRTDCVSSLSPIARISCQSTRRLVSGSSYCDSVLLADPSLGPTNHDNSSIVYRISFSCKLIIFIARKMESNLSRS